MKLKVALHNIGGELDSRVVEFRQRVADRSRPIENVGSVEEMAAQAAIEMIRETGELRPGDTIFVTELT